MREINTQNITLLPFTLENFGAMGSLAQRYFNDVKPTPEIANTNDLISFTKEVTIAYNRGRK